MTGLHKVSALGQDIILHTNSALKDDNQIIHLGADRWIFF